MFIRKLSVFVSIYSSRFRIFILTMSFTGVFIVCFESTYSWRFRIFTLSFNYQYSNSNMQLTCVVSLLNSLHSGAKIENVWLGDRKWRHISICGLLFQQTTFKLIVLLKYIYTSKKDVSVRILCWLISLSYRLPQIKTNLCLHIDLLQDQ